MNEAKLREYAKLIVKIGANVQKGQRVRLQAGVWNARKSPRTRRRCTTLPHCSGMQTVFWDLRRSRPSPEPLCVT